MRLYPRRRNVAAQMAEKLKTVTYDTPPMEERRKKTKSHPYSSTLVLVTCRPDMTSAVDWVLKTNYLSICGGGVVSY